MKTKNRIKAPVSENLSRAEVEALLVDFQLICINEQKLLAKKNSEVSTVEQRYASQLGEIASGKKSIALRLQTWAEANPAEFEKRKSIETPCGKLGFRTGTPKLGLLNRKWTWETVLQRMRSIRGFWGGYIRTKEEIDKDALLAAKAAGMLDDQALADSGMKVTQEEAFYVEPKMDEPEARTTNTAPLKEGATWN
jgi:phage host-nuclease inhibitor protein Gam